MIALRKSFFEEIPIFINMGSQSHANRFVGQDSLAEIENSFTNPDHFYLTITANGNRAGYFTLVKENLHDIEFRRIVIDQSQRGVGQQSIRVMEEYCVINFNSSRIWLDVYDDNLIGIHIYEKLGYQCFREESRQDRKLLFYEKNLKSNTSNM